MATGLTPMITSRQLYNKLKDIQVGSPLCRFTEQSCENLLPIIQRIEKLKKEKNAIVLAHNYVAPQILYSVADHTGDSYGLAKRARESSAEIIVFASVRFMAETAKILNPNKVVLDPNPEGGCTLADGITAEDVKNLRREFPNHTFVCYINTTAEVKALCDTCVTSSNAYKVIERIENDKIYFLPDRLMGENVKKYLNSFENIKTLWEVCKIPDFQKLMTENYFEFLNFHNNCRPASAALTMMTFRTDTPSTCGIVELDSSGFVLRFYEKIPNPPGDLANGAVDVSAEPELFDAKRDTRLDLLVAG